MNETGGLLALRDMERDYERERRIKIDVGKTEYPLLRNIALHELGWNIWGKEDQKGEANIFWSDTYVTEENVKRLKYYQRINHFPNSQELGKKNFLSINLKKMSRLMPQQFDFFPSTWVYPEEEEDFESNNQADKWYIVKPAASSQGRGIYFAKNINAIRKEPSVIQEYIQNPHLIEKCKYDLRIYVLIKSLTPLKIFKFQQGLTRLATHEYEALSKENKKDYHMHLTNYAINKSDPLYISNKDINEDYQGHKRSLASVYRQLQQEGCDIVVLKEKIDEIIVKTILSAYPKMQASYKSCRDHEIETQSVCFQILGFDVLIDNSFKPWLLEVNHSPSFCTESPLDLVIKKCLLLDSLVLLNIKNVDKEQYLRNKNKEQPTHVLRIKSREMKRKEEIQYEQKHLGGFHQIYPNNKDSYSQIMNRLGFRKSDKKSFLKLANRSFYPIEKQCLSFSPQRKKSHDASLTFYGKLQFYDKNYEKSYDKSTELSDVDEIFQKNTGNDKRKSFSPIKMKNVSIGFSEGMKTLYHNGHIGRQCSSNAHQPLLGAIKGQLFENPIPEYQSCDANRSFTKMQKQIKSKVNKMKLARIRISKMKSTDRKQERVYHNITKNSNYV